MSRHHAFSSRQQCEAPLAGVARPEPSTRGAGPSVARRWVPVLLLALLAAACVPGIKLRTVELTEKHPLAQLSEETRQTLRLMSLEERYEEEPTAVLTGLEALPDRDRRPEILSAVAELAFLEALDAAPLDLDRASHFYLQAAMRSYDSLRQRTPSVVHAGFDPRFHQLREIYNRSVGQYVALLLDRGHFPLRDRDEPLLREVVTLSVGRGEGLWEPEYFDELHAVDEIEVQGIRNRYRRPGLGAPLIAFRVNRQATPEEAFFPPEGIHRSATAVLRFEPRRSSSFDRRRRATLELYDPYRVETVLLAGNAVPLAADFTAPLAYLISQTELRQLGKRGLRDAEQVEYHQGLFLMQPFDPEKIPVVMVHGLRSSPLAWLELTNDLRGDPELRRRYQIWHYMYPSGLPYLYSGRRLRFALEDLRACLAQEGPALALNEMVIVAHSMGGMLTRSLVTHSGDAVWNATFLGPASSLSGAPEDLVLAEEIFHFQPLPYIRRVVFIATPHRGSQLAASVVGRLGASLVRLPQDFTEMLRRLSVANSHMLTPEMSAVLSQGQATSIRTLSPEHPLTRIVGRLPIAEGVTAHNIVGDRGRSAGAEISDGIVAYQSAHLPDAASELIVPSGHNAHSHPMAIEEVKRILHQHLRDGASAPAVMTSQ